LASVVLSSPSLSSRSLASSPPNSTLHTSHSTLPASPSTLPAAPRERQLRHDPFQWVAFGVAGFFLFIQLLLLVSLDLYY
jgi:hypothetical protein